MHFFNDAYIESIFPPRYTYMGGRTANATFWERPTNETVAGHDDNGRKTLSEYISRAPFSLERMSFH